MFWLINLQDTRQQCIICYSFTMNKHKITSSYAEAIIAFRNSIICRGAMWSKVKNADKLNCVSVMIQNNYCTVGRLDRLDDNNSFRVFSLVYGYDHLAWGRHEPPGME